LQLCPSASRAYNPLHKVTSGGGLPGSERLFEVAGKLLFTVAGFIPTPVRRKSQPSLFQRR